MHASRSLGSQQRGREKRTMESLLLTGCLLLSFLVITIVKAFLWKDGKGKKWKLPPSPPSLPIVGHMLYLRGHKPLHKSLALLASKYGDVVFLRIGSRPALIISSASAAEQCLIHHDIIFANRPDAMVGAILGNNYTSINFASYGPHYTNLRRTAAMEIMSMQRINHLASIRTEEVKLLARELAAAAGGGFKRKDLSSTFPEFTFQIMMRMVMGVKVEKGDPQWNHFIEIFDQTRALLSTMFPGDFISLMKLLDFGRFEKELQRVREDGNNFLRKIVDERRRSMLTKEMANKQKEIRCLVDFLKEQQAVDPDYYNEDIILVNLMFMLTAGSDSSAVAIQWALALLINHPDVLQKVRDEVEARVEKGALVGDQDLPHLPYFQAVIAETLRLYPSLPFLFPHATSQDCVINGYDVPADTFVLFNIPAIHRDENLWEEADKFKAERFLDNKELTSKSGNGCKFIPFGAGRRRCPGEDLGLRNVMLTMATLVQCFDWKSADGEKIDMEEESGFTMKKKVPLEVMYRARELMLPALGL